MITLDFLITSLIVVLIPGTGVVFTVSTALILGRRAALFAALGCTAGIVPHLLATVLGLAALLHLMSRERGWHRRPFRHHREMPPATGPGRDTGGVGAASH